MPRPIVPLPLAAYAARVLDSVAMRPGTEAVLEAMGRGVADQQAILGLLAGAEAKGEPLPLHVLESMRFSAEKNAGLARFLLQRALAKKSASNPKRSPEAAAPRAETDKPSHPGPALGHSA